MPFQYYLRWRFKTPKRTIKLKSTLEMDDTQNPKSKSKIKNKQQQQQQQQKEEKEVKEVEEENEELRIEENEEFTIKDTISYSFLVFPLYWLYRKKKTSNYLFLILKHKKIEMQQRCFKAKAKLLGIVRKKKKICFENRYFCIWRCLNNWNLLFLKYI